MQHTVKGKPQPPAKVKRGKPSHANIEALNGGGFKTTLHHASANPSGEMYGPRPEPIEAAHKNYKGARKALDDHFMATPDEGTGAQ